MILAVIHRKAELLPIFSIWLKLQRQISIEELALLKPEAIVKDEVKIMCIKRLKDIKLYDKKPDNLTKAAVLVPLCTYKGKLGLLYTLRSSKVSKNRGQVSFPGGMKDSKDSTLEDTALRETWEELQIAKKNIDIWGTANLINNSPVAVLPVLGYLGKINPQSLKVNKTEVDEAFVLTLENLCDPKLFRYTQFRDGRTLPIYLGGNYKIWGLTAIITHMILTALVPGVYKHQLPYMEPVENKKEISFTKSDMKKSWFL